MTIFLILLLACAALLAALGFAFASFSMGIRPQTLEEARAWQADHYDLSWYDALEKTDYTVTAGDGYVLHAQRLACPSPAGKLVIISHGYTDNRYGALKYARIYLDLGFDVIVYDLRGHGENEPTFCTYSLRESGDLNAIIADSRARWPQARVLGLHGESLGAATSVAVLKYAPPVDFAVADCGFSEIESVLAGGLKRMHVPAWMTRVASLCAKLRYGCSYDDMRPIDSLKNSDVPILFIHGENDDFIPPSHSQAMHAAAGGCSECRLIPGAGHAASVLTAPDAYRTYVEAFLKKLNL